MARNKGSEGQGESKSVSWREGRKSKKAKSSKSSPVKNENGALAMVTLTVGDFLNGRAVTGHHVAIGDAVFEIKKETLILVKAACKQLAPFVDKAQHVFVSEGQLTNNAFESPLSHAAREKQMAMWSYIRAAIGEEGRVAILKRREMDRLMPPEKAPAPIIMTEPPLAQEEPAYVGENAKRWNEASAEIATAFESMSADKPAEIRIGDNQHEGVTFGFFYSGSIRAYVGHVGAKSSLSGKVLNGTFLEIRDGKVPQSLPESLKLHARGKYAVVIHQFLMDLPRNLRDPIMHGLYQAAGRISMGSRKEQTAAQPHPRQPPMLQVVKTDPSEQASSTRQSAPVIATGVEELVSALRKTGATPSEIAEAVLAYQSKTSDGAQKVA